MNTQTCCLPLPGLHCNSCAVALERAAECQRGVVSAHCNPATGALHVEYVPTVTDPQAIRAGVAAAAPYPVGEPIGAAAAPDAEREARLAEIRYFKLHTWISAILTLPVLAGSLPTMLGLSTRIPILSDPWFQAILTAPVVFWGGASFFSGAWATLRNRTADMNTLVAVGTFAAYAYSVAALVFPGLFHGADTRPEYYFETAAVVTTLILLGRVLEAVAKGATSDAMVEGRGVAIGSRKLLQQLELDAGALGETAEALAAAGKTPFYVAVDGAVAGVIAVADTLKPTAREAIARLQALGLEVIMLTGDNRRTAEAVAREVGIQRVLAEVLPGEKAETIRKVQGEGKVVAMVGDGINDAPALAQADLGIAIGTGTDVAMAAADVTLMTGDLNGVVKAIALSRATMRNVKQNLFFAYVYNGVGVPVAAMGLLSPILAGAAMALSSVSVVLNAGRLRRFRLG